MNHRATQRIFAALLALAFAACELFHPVRVKPPPAPAAFQASVDLSEDPAEPVKNEPGLVYEQKDPASLPQPGSIKGNETNSASPQPASNPQGDQTPNPQPPSKQPEHLKKNTQSSPPEERVTDKPVWWSAFSDPVLDNAIQESFRNNLILRDVRGLIYENQVDPTVPQGWWYPLQIGVLNPAGYKHVVAVVPPAPSAHIQFGEVNADIGVNYQVDLFGVLAAQRQAGLNFAEQQRQLTEARVQDQAVRVTQLWFDILEARALRDLTLTQIKYNKELYQLIQARFDQHLTPRLVVLQQEQLLVNLQSQVPLITTRNALLNSELKTYLGRVPNPDDDIVPLDRQLPDLPPPPYLGTPIDLNVNTPEMRLAELRVAEVGHKINANAAAWLPMVSLVGSFGAAQVGLWQNQPLYNESLFGVNFTWQMFDGKRLTEAMQLRMQLQRRKIQYQLAMNTAIGRVQDAVIQEDNEATSLRSLRHQVELGRQLLAEARRGFEMGNSDYLTVLTALTNLVELERASLQAQRLLLNHRVEVYRSLGGTWSYDVTRKRE